MRPIKANAKKLSRAAAFEVVTRLRDGGAAAEHELDGLFLHLAPGKTPKKASSDRQWCGVAVADSKEKRQFLRYVITQKGWMYGSNGHRVHRVRADLPDGYYHPTTFTPVDFDYPAPDMGRFFLPDLQGLLLDTDALVVEVVKGLRCVRVPGGVGVQESYWREAAATLCRVENGKFVGRSAFGEFVIMGVCF